MRRFVICSLRRNTHTPSRFLTAPHAQSFANRWWGLSHPHPPNLGTFCSHFAFPHLSLRKMVGLCPIPLKSCSGRVKPPTIVSPNKVGSLLTKAWGAVFDTSKRYKSHGGGFRQSCPHSATWPLWIMSREAPAPDWNPFPYSAAVLLTMLQVYHQPLKLLGRAPFSLALPHPSTHIKYGHKPHKPQPTSTKCAKG